MLFDSSLPHSPISLSLPPLLSHTVVAVIKQLELDCCAFVEGKNSIKFLHTNANASSKVSFGFCFEMVSCDQRCQTLVWGSQLKHGRELQEGTRTPLSNTPLIIYDKLTATTAGGSCCWITWLVEGHPQERNRKHSVVVSFNLFSRERPAKCVGSSSQVPSTQRYWFK